ncbi:MAG TPA: cytosine permease [Rhizomicrobium sp.]|nr:cytosine permease [Rhizomicrobium sp.]
MAEDNEVGEAEAGPMTTLHHQPGAVEQYGIEPIPPALRTVGWFDLFSIFINFLINPGDIIKAGLAVAAGLSVPMAILAQFVGTLLAIFFYVAMANVGVDYGVPGQVAARTSFGIRGAKLLPSLLRLVVSTYYFAFQTIVGSVAIMAVLEKLFAIKPPMLLVAILFGILQAGVALFGYDYLKRLSRLALPVKIVVLGYLFYVMASHPDPNFSPLHILRFTGTQTFTWLLLLTWLNTSITSWLSMTTDSADFCRYSSSRNQMWIGVFAATLIGTLITGLFGAYGAAATLGKDSNSFTVIANIHPTMTTLLAILLVIGLDNWTINVLNLYTGGLSLNNIWGKLGRFWSTLIVSVFSIALCLVPDLLTDFLNYVGVIGTIFAPISGILVFDYLLIRRMKVDVPALYQAQSRYWYWHGFNPVAVMWMVIGFLLYMFVIPELWLKPLLTAVLTGAGYSLTYAAIHRSAMAKAIGLADAPAPGG